MRDMEHPTNLGRFVVGMPRAGTTAMIRALGTDARVAAFGETLFWGRHWVAPDEDGRLDRARIEQCAARLATLKLEPAGPDGLWESSTAPITPLSERLGAVPAGASPAEAFHALTSAVLEMTGRRFWVEKTPHHMMHLDRILRWLPESRFVVMLRAPEAFLQSYKQQGDRKPPEVRRKFHRLYHPAAASLVARRTYHAAAQASRLEQVLLVPLEAVQDDPSTWMTRIRTHLRLPTDAPTEFERDNSSFADGHVATRPLTRAELAWLRLLAGNAASIAGYPPNSLPRSPLALLSSAATLPWWAARNARTIASLDQGGLRALLRRWLR